MSTHRRGTALAALVAAVCLAPGCTLFDDYVSGTPFTPDQPQMTLTVVGGVQVDRAGTSRSPGCRSGGTVFWGTVRNDGDVDVDGVTIIVDAYNAAGDLLGTFSGDVFNGNEIEGTDETVPTAETNLVVDQSGTFEVCAAISFDSVARAEGRADGVVIEESGIE